MAEAVGSRSLFYVLLSNWVLGEGEPFPLAFVTRQKPGRQEMSFYFTGFSFSTAFALSK